MSYGLSKTTPSNSPPIVEVLARQIARAQRPRRRQCKRFVLENLGHLFTLSQQFLETKHVPIDTLTVGGPGGVLNMPTRGGSEQLGPFDVGSIGVQHGVDKRLALRAGRPDDLGPSQPELSRLRAFVGHGGFPSGHLAIGELFDHLNPGIGRDLVLLDRVLAVLLEVHDL